MGAIQTLHRAQMGVSGGGKYIKFADPEVLRVLLANGVSSDGVGITLEDAARVTSIGAWFQGNTSILEFEELEKFTGLTKINENAFSGCVELRVVRFSETPFTMNVVWNDYDTLFYNCTSLESVKLPSTLTGNLWNGVFKGCTSLKNVNIPNGITSIGVSTFKDCSSLILDASSLINITALDAGAFMNSGLSGVLDLPNLTTFKQTKAEQGGVFAGTKITEIRNLGSLTSMPYGTNNSSGSFSKCTLLRFAVLPISITNISSYAFYGCSSLTTLVIEATTPPTLGNYILTSTPIASGAGYIYVPDASVDAYKAATNWATYANQIKPLSEYNNG